MSEKTWKPVDMSGLRERLADIRTLLEQAAAVGLAQDMTRLESLARLEAHTRKDGGSNVQRRRYR